MTNVSYKPFLSAVFAILPVAVNGGAAAGDQPVQGEKPQTKHTQHTKHWRMVLQAEGNYGHYGAIEGKLLLVSPDGQDERVFHFVSGPWKKGALPGLDPKSDHYLRRPVQGDENKPRAQYHIGKPIFNVGERAYQSNADAKHLAHKAPKADFFIPFDHLDKVVIGRHGLGLHPTQDMPDGSLACTKGCVGIPNKDSVEFERLYRSLLAQGAAPVQLEVYTKAKMPEEFSKPVGEIANKGRGL